MRDHDNDHNRTRRDGDDGGDIGNRPQRCAYHWRDRWDGWSDRLGGRGARTFEREINPAMYALPRSRTGCDRRGVFGNRGVLNPATL